MQVRISQLEKQLRNQAQLEEEVKMYREQAKALTEQLTLSGAVQSPRSGRSPRTTTPRAAAEPAAASPEALGGSLISSMSKHAAGLAAKGGSMLGELAEPG